MINFHLLRHFRLHFHHRVEKILELLKFVTSSINCRSCCVDRPDIEWLLDDWPILHKRVFAWTSLVNTSASRLIRSFRVDVEGCCGADRVVQKSQCGPDWVDSVPSAEGFVM